MNFTQEDLRQAYKQTFDNVMNPWPEPKLKSNDDNNLLPLVDEIVESADELEEKSRDDFDTDSDSVDANENDIEVNFSESLDDTIIDDEIDVQEQDTNETGSASANEFQSKEDEVEDLQDADNTYSLEEDIIEQPMSFDTLVEHLDEDQKRSFKLEYQRQVREFNEKMRTIINGLKLLSTSDSSTLFLADNVTDEPHSQKLIEDCHVSIPSITVNPQSVQLEEIIATNILSSLEAISLDNSVQGIYEFQAKNFGADKGAPSVCTVCYRSNHTKSECPELTLLEIIDLPKIEKTWSDVLACLCRKMAEECKPNKEGIEERKTILNYLEMEFRKKYPNSRLCAYGSFYNGFGLQHSDLDICVLLELNKKETTIQVLENLAQSMESNKNMLRVVEIVRNARVPIIRSIHLQSSIEIDISLNNTLPIENTRLLKMYSDIDPRVRELGSVMKTLAKKCDIGDASRGTLSSYAYTIMVIHFLQQIQPPVVPVLQQLNDVQSTNTPIIRKCADWNIYFYDDLTKLNQVWSGYGLNTLSSGALWIEFLRYYTERFDYEKHIVTIRQYEPLLRLEKGWFRPTIAIEDPFLLTHNLADRLSLQKWTTIRRVFLHARQQFCSQPNIIDINMSTPNMEQLQEHLFNKHALCPKIADKLSKKDSCFDDISKQSRTQQHPNNNKRKKPEEKKPSIMADIHTDLSTRNFDKQNQKRQTNSAGRGADYVFVSHRRPTTRWPPY